MVKVTGSGNRRVSLAALLCIKPGQRPRLIYRVHHRRKRGTGQGKGGTDQRKGFTEADYARLPAPRTSSSPARSCSCGTT